MNSTPRSNRFHIGIFGRCNSGKSSLINAITNQKISIVSKIKGTTTDANFKAMEIGKIGPCVLIDTPGFDDEEENLGKLRIEKTNEILNYVDAAILVIKNNKVPNKSEIEMFFKIKKRKIPILIAANKSDLISQNFNLENIFKGTKILKISAKTKENIDLLLDLISTTFKQEKENFMVSDLLNPKDTVILVVVIDESYPKARLILPQQQLINELLKKGVFCYVCRNFEYEQLLQKIKIKPKLIVTDSQIFPEIFEKTPADFLITSFSILLARRATILETAIKSVKYLDFIKQNDNILICESCTHKKNSCDIGSVKIPKLIQQRTKKTINFEFMTGTDFPQNIKKYKLIIHCGGCMISTNIIKNRFEFCEKNKVPITNYGVLFSYLNGVLEKSTSFLNELKN